METANTVFPSDSGASQHGGRMKTDIPRCPHGVPGTLLCTSNLSTSAHPEPGKRSISGGVDHQAFPCPGRRSSGRGLVHGWMSQWSLDDTSALHKHYQHVHQIHGILICENRQVNSACGFCHLVWVITKGRAEVDLILESDWFALHGDRAHRAKQPKCCLVLFVPHAPDRAAAALCPSAWCHWAVPSLSKDIFVQTKATVCWQQSC